MSRLLYVVIWQISDIPAAENPFNLTYISFRVLYYYQVLSLVNAIAILVAFVSGILY